MQVTMSAEYAIRAMIFLAENQRGEVIPIETISRESDIPDNFLRKIIPQLTRAGLVMSHRGTRGGVSLARTAEKVTALDVLEAIEGKMYLNKCLFSEDYCERSDMCSMHDVWIVDQQKMEEVLSGNTLKELAERNKIKR
jgi:Rrf2 family iron-sulfur cluster assembly transcriptional regulator